MELVWASKDEGTENRLAVVQTVAEALQSMMGRVRQTETKIVFYGTRIPYLYLSITAAVNSRRRIYTREEEEEEDEVFSKYSPRAWLSYRRLQPWWIDDKRFNPAFQRRTIKQLPPSGLL